MSWILKSNLCQGSNHRQDKSLAQKNKKSKNVTIQALVRHKFRYEPVLASWSGTNQGLGQKGSGTSLGGGHNLSHFLVALKKGKFVTNQALVRHKIVA